jgi:hypothetical protein
LLPLDIECGAAPHRRPRRGSYDSDAACENNVGFTGRGAIDFKNVEDALDLACPAVIECLDPGVEDGRPGNNGISHVRLDGVDAVHRLARYYVARVDCLAARADDAVVICSLE